MASTKRTTSRKTLVTRLQRSWGFDTLDALDRQLLAMTLAQPSVSMTHLASMVNRTRQNVAKRIGRPAFQNALAEGQLDAIQRVERYRVQAIETLAALMQKGQSPHVRLRAALFFAAPVQPSGGATDDVHDYAEFAIEANRRWQEAYKKGEIRPPAPPETGPECGPANR